MIRRKLFSTILIMALVLIGLSLSVVGVTAREPAAPSADTDIVINEVYYLGNSATEDWIELKNVGSETIDVSSWFFCARFSYSFQTLANLTLLDGSDLILGPGEIITLQAWTNLDNTASDLGLYISDSSFADPNNMVDFVQWGTADDVGRSDVAAAKGIWTETATDQYDFVATAGAGQSLAYGGSNGGGGLLTLSSDFSNGTPTRGAENTISETASLEVSKKASSSTIAPNGLITYTLTVSSSGTISNTNVVLTDTVPVSTTLAFADVSPVDDVLTWDLGDMSPSTVITRTFAVTASAPGGTSLFPSGTVIINDDYGVQSDQAAASGSPIEVTVVVADKFIYLPIILRSSAPQ